MKLYQHKFINLEKEDFQNLESLNLKNNHNKDLDLSASLNHHYKLMKDEISKNQIAEISMIYDEENFNNSIYLFQKLRDFENIIILATGGSSLGGKSFASLNNENKLIFIESIDPETISCQLKNVNFQKTAFLVISKSGETIETICQTLIIINILQELNLKPVNHLFFISNSTENTIAKIAKEIGSKIHHHPSISGRYSCFSIVGLVPALIAGLDIKKIHQGAELAISEFINDEDIKNACFNQLKLYNIGFRNSVFMPYIDNLKNFNDWYRQICAESLGKNNFGITPINSMGTIDQHSQLQLYLDGPNDKFFTFIIADNYKKDFIIKGTNQNKTIFDNYKISEILKIEFKATIATLKNHNLPIRIFEIENLNEESLGKIMMQMMLEIILIAKVQGFSPFDQPAIEMRKVLAKEFLKNN